jgi:predicted regulator of Ras-like GTPase activity (Roadblock/LC7/MglB family)
MPGQSESIGSYRLRSGLTISPAQDAAFDGVLNDLVQKIPARFALLTDTSGLLIGFRGEGGQMDLVALGSLIAGDLAASQAIADMTGEHADYQLVLRQGRQHNLLLVGAGQRLVLLVQAPADVPVGWSRVLVLEAARQLQAILETPSLFEEPLPAAPELVENGLTDLFSQALDSLWSD